MGGKGLRRREKNFRAAHGGYARLPPPPKSSDIDALPSKLRKLMDFTENPNKDHSTPTTPPIRSLKGSKDMERTGKKKGAAAAAAEKKRSSKDEPDSKNAKSKRGDNDEKVETPNDIMNEDDDDDAEKRDKRKAKRKRKQINDLRFEATTQGLGSTGLKRKERKKKYLEAKKNKHKKAKTEETLDFPGREEIKFGDIVQAPPKLLAVPKGLKTVQAASHERIRLQAVEAYRNRKGWTSRLGVRIPLSVTPDPSN